MCIDSIRSCIWDAGQGQPELAQATTRGGKESTIPLSHSAQTSTQVEERKWISNPNHNIGLLES